MKSSMVLAAATVYGRYNSTVSLPDFLVVFCYGTQRVKLKFVRHNYDTNQGLYGSTSQRSNKHSNSEVDSYRLFELKSLYSQLECTRRMTRNILVLVITLIADMDQDIYVCQKWYEELNQTLQWGLDGSSRVQAYIRRLAENMSKAEQQVLKVWLLMDDCAKSSIVTKRLAEKKAGIKAMKALPF